MIKRTTTNSISRKQQRGAIPVWGGPGVDAGGQPYLWPFMTRPVNCHQLVPRRHHFVYLVTVEVNCQVDVVVHATSIALNSTFKLSSFKNEVRWYWCRQLFTKWLVTSCIMHMSNMAALVSGWWRTHHVNNLRHSHRYLCLIYGFLLVVSSPVSLDLLSASSGTSPYHWAMTLLSINSSKLFLC